MVTSQTIPDSLKARAQRAVQESNWQEAELLYRQLVAMVEYLFGSDHIEIVMSAHALASVLEKLNKREEALKWREKTSDLLLKLDKRL